MGTLYSDADLGRLRRWKIYLPLFQGEIPMPPAPSYRQVREPAATKQSLHRVAAPDTPAESPHAKCSSSKGGPQRGSGCSSNTSTLKHPDSTSAKKPSCPKESTWMIRQSLHSPAALASADICPLPPQGQQSANKGIFVGRTLVWSTPLFLSAPACLTPSAVQRVPLAT